METLYSTTTILQAKKDIKWIRVKVSRVVDVGQAKVVTIYIWIYMYNLNSIVAQATLSRGKIMVNNEAYTQ